MSEIHAPYTIDEPPPATTPAGEVGEFHRPASVAYERTWELELLISGAVVFALLQLPGALDRWFYRVDLHLAGVTHEIAFFIYYYTKLIVYTLIGTFILHLAARAYWVGLLGLDTVFPHGVRWERLTYGPLMRELYREKQPSLETVIRRVDRFCSIIFSFAFLLVFIFLYSVVLLGALGLVGVAISTLFFEGAQLATIMRWLLVIILAPAILLSVIDRLMKGKLDRSHGPRRVLYRAMAIFYVLQAALACLGRLQPVRLNDQPVEPRYRAFTEPETGRRGIVAFLPTDGLPEGENLLTAGAIHTNPDRPLPARTRSPSGWSGESCTVGSYAAV